MSKPNEIAGAATGIGPNAKGSAIPRPLKPLLELPAILEHAWMHLERAPRDRTHGFHLPIFATAAEGGWPDARIVVLRKVIVPARMFLAHTDIRAPKVAAVAKQPRTAWVFYDHRQRLQLRVQADTHVEHRTPLADAQWEASSPSSRRCYLAPHVPSSESAEFDPNIPVEFMDHNPAAEETGAGRENFSVVVSVIKEMEVLILASEGHIRAGYRWEDGDALRMTWLRP